MQRDLLDALRCPGAHEESWLVAMVLEARGSALLAAELACPMCGAEFRIVDGIAYIPGLAPGSTPPPALPSEPLAIDLVLRLAALLGVVESHLPVALVGRYAAASVALASVVSAPQLLVNSGAVIPAPGVSRLVVADRLPLGVETLAAIAVDAEHATPAFLESAARALRLGGRLVAPADVPVPAGLRELARDATEWVAETTARASGLVELRRRAPESVG
ncbi:hypothetical protein [Gemmatimonas sp.]|jgi:uncharacterized protein YbaR (Trm112 family)|uniref:hypothetical protein n=1 Tax=Gemmatimonas sp. TaxID=1962908 RepID=UPI0037C11BDC